MAKINKELVEQIGQLIMTHVSRDKLVSAIERYKTAGLTEQRFLWNLLWAVPTIVSKPWFNTVYALDCNDEHITTALRAWFKSTGLEY